MNDEIQELEQLIREARDLSVHRSNREADLAAAREAARSADDAFQAKRQEIQKLVTRLSCDERVADQRAMVDA